MRHKRRPSAIVLLVSNPQGLRILPSNDRRTISDLGKTTVLEENTWKLYNVSAFAVEKMLLVLELSSTKPSAARQTTFNFDLRLWPPTLTSFTPAASIRSNTTSKEKHNNQQNWPRQNSRKCSHYIWLGFGCSTYFYYKLQRTAVPALLNCTMSWAVPLPPVPPITHMLYRPLSISTTDSTTITNDASMPEAGSFRAYLKTPTTCASTYDYSTMKTAPVDQLVACRYLKLGAKMLISVYKMGTITKYSPLSHKSGCDNEACVYWTTLLSRIVYGPQPIPTKRPSDYWRWRIGFLAKFGEFVLVIESREDGMSVQL